MRIWTKAVIASAGTLAMLGLSAAPALASAGPSRTVTAVTHTSDHPDTTSVSGECTMPSSHGPVWANDNLSLRFQVTPMAEPGNYSVTITAHGSFAAFANPRTGDCYTGRGSVNGWLHYDVHSSTQPDPRNLPAQEPGDLSQGDILQALFGGHASIIGGGQYSYTYTLVDGSKYTQTS